MNKKLKVYKVYWHTCMMKKKYINLDFLIERTRDVIAPFLLDLSEKEYGELFSFLSLLYADFMNYIQKTAEKEDLFLWHIYVIYKQETMFSMLITSFNRYSPNFLKNDNGLIRTEDVVYQVIADKKDPLASKISGAIAKNLSLLPRFFEKQLIDMVIQN